MTLTDYTVEELRAGYQTKEFSVLDVVEAHLVRIGKENPNLNAYIEVFDDVRKAAEEADRMIARGDTAPLLGIPCAIKDNIFIKGKRASAASRILEHHTAAYDATAVARLKKAGALFLGRTNMDEFAFGSSTENSAFGPTKNPHHHAYTPGGTSGGSAAAVAANLAPLALGTDTGGSVRNPAAFCGIYGIKPTYGAVSRSGVIAAASSFDQVGVLGRSVGDVETGLSVIAGYDPLDGTTIPDASRTLPPHRGKKIGVPRALLAEGVDPDVARACDAALARLVDAGYVLVDIELPHAAVALATYYILIFAEESTNLSRYDGMRYGLSCEGSTLADVYEQTRAAGFGPETKRRIMLGTHILSAGYYDAYYRRANALRALIVDDYRRAFETVDVVATPTMPTLPFKIGEKSMDPLAMYLSDILTVSPNITGMPALSIPVGMAERDGATLPIGLQLIGAWHAEPVLFTVARDLAPGV